MLLNFQVKFWNILRIENNFERFIMWFWKHFIKSKMTNLTVNEIYAVGAPIVLAMILFEVLFSSASNKNLYKKEDTLCTIGLLTGNILMVFALKGATLGLHFYLFQFKLLNLSLIHIWRCRRRLRCRSRWSPYH